MFSTSSPGLWPGQRRRHSGGAEPGHCPAPSSRAQRLGGDGLQRQPVGCLCGGVLHLCPPAGRLLRLHAGGVDTGSECLRIVAPWLIYSAMGVVLARGFDGAVWNPPFA